MKLPLTISALFSSRKNGGGRLAAVEEGGACKVDIDEVCEGGCEYDWMLSMFEIVGVSVVGD